MNGSLQIIAIISALSVGIPLFAYYSKRKQKTTESIRVIVALLIVALCFDAGGYALFVQGYRNEIVSNIYNIISTALIFYFYYLILAGTRDITLFIGLLFFIIGGVVSITIQGFFEHQNIFWTSNALVFSIYGFTFLRSLETGKTSKNINNNTAGLLTINAALLFYFTSNLFLFIVVDYIFTHLSTSISLTVWTFHNVVSIIKNIGIACGISQAKKNHMQN